MKQPCFALFHELPLRYFLLLCLIILLQTSQNAQSTSFKSPTNGILGTSGAMEKSPWAFFTNPSGLSELTMPVAGIGYQSDFHLKELSARTAFASLPLRVAVLSGGFTHSGYELFNTQQYSFALARRLAPWLNMGLRFNYLYRHLSANQNVSLITLDAGWQIAPSDKFQLGFFVLNPASSQWILEDEEEDQPMLMATSVAYIPVKGLQLEAGLAKEMEFPPNISLMISCQVHKAITIRGSAASAPLRFGLGSGILWQNIQFDMGLAHHETLGLSSSFGIFYQLKQTLIK
jgi:hypothetical protein